MGTSSYNDLILMNFYIKIRPCLIKTMCALADMDMTVSMFFAFTHILGILINNKFKSYQLISYYKRLVVTNINMIRKQSRI